MRKPIIIANWKMYTNLADAHILSTAVRNGTAKIEGVEIVLCPPVIWLLDICQIIKKGGRLKLGAQNIYSEPEGAYTGEISPLMVKDVADYVIVGHSERREYFNEKDFDVNEKVIAALRAGLRPVLCVGEKRKKDIPVEPLNQLKEALQHVPKSHFKDIIVAYEPIWAIGTGENAEPEHVARVLTLLREIIGPQTSLLYGGSVKSTNIKEYALRPEIDGVLVGGASLRAAEFIKICQTWSRSKSFIN